MFSHNLPKYDSNIKAAVVGRNRDTGNYENALHDMGISCITTMDIGKLSDFDVLLLPGGGDITPAFFGQKNQGSRNIDVELDITQLQALDLFVKWKRPVLGICKGLQVINIYCGGTITQDMPQSPHHAWDNGDRSHVTTALPGSFLYTLYGDSFVTNSAHHQGVAVPGRNLTAIQWADDNIVEGMVHDFLPVIGVQWHPERLFTPSPSNHSVDGRLLFAYFLSLCSPVGT